MCVCLCVCLLLRLLKNGKTQFRAYLSKIFKSKLNKIVWFQFCKSGECLLHYCCLLF